ncbi:MAG: DNA-directed RNA polymerase subunit N [Gemmatimonadaceae bacterium]|jgi:DNA-directed RNA polymerase subunit N (RpoN/RPB10)|nr:DNA-directed RNA polymerase subunit N [Gemmatimonadaceae bacterium]
MIVPIRCFTCAKIIADKYDYYNAEVAKLEKEGKTNQDPDYKYFSKIHTKEILDNLGLDRYCCRRMILSASDMMHII